MEPAIPFDWHRIFIGNEPLLYYAEILFRVVVIYVWAMVLLRYMGKRGSRNLSAMENVVIIALGSATGDAMFYPEVPLTYAMVVVALVVLLSRGLADWEVRNAAVNEFTDGAPLLMLREGEIVEEALAKARMRRDEFLGELRTAGYRHTREVQWVIMERTGELSVFAYEDEDAQAKGGESTWPEKLVGGEGLRIYPEHWPKIRGELLVRRLRMDLT